MDPVDKMDRYNDKKSNSGVNMPCPYYRAGMCTSPKLEQPSDDVVAATRCLGNSPESYMACSLYVAIEHPKGLEIVVGKGGVRVGTVSKQKIYAPIHLLREQLQCECIYFSLAPIEGEKGYVARCSLLRRYLTKYEARLCARHWRDCPYPQPVLSGIA